MLRKLMIGSATLTLALAAGVMTMSKPASAEPWWVAAGPYSAGPYYEGYYDAGYDVYAPGYYSAGYYGPAPGPYGYRCRYIVTEQAPDGTGFRERVCTAP